MRLFNQTKSPLRWSLAAGTFEAEPWGAVDVPDELVPAVRRLGVPLDVSPVAPELRAKQRIADDQAAHSSAATTALKQRAERAEADARAAREELERSSVELSRVRSDLREANELAESLRDQLARAKADAKAAEGLLSEQAAAAASSEERAIKAEALLNEKQAPKPKRASGAE